MKRYGAFGSLVFINILLRMDDRRTPPLIKAFLLVIIPNRFGFTPQADSIGTELDTPVCIHDCSRRMEVVNVYTLLITGFLFFFIIFQCLL